MQHAAEIYERAGKMYTRARDYDKALAAYRLARERSPDVAARLNYYLAQIYQEKSKSSR